MMQRLGILYDATEMPKYKIRRKIKYKGQISTKRTTKSLGEAVFPYFRFRTNVFIFVRKEFRISDLAFR